MLRFNEILDSVTDRVLILDPSLLILNEEVQQPHSHQSSQSSSHLLRVAVSLTSVALTARLGGGGGGGVSCVWCWTCVVVSVPAVNVWSWCWVVFLLAGHTQVSTFVIGGGGWQKRLSCCLALPSWGWCCVDTHHGLQTPLISTQFEPKMFVILVKCSVKLIVFMSLELFIVKMSYLITENITIIEQYRVPLSVINTTVKQVSNV